VLVRNVADMDYEIIRARYRFAVVSFVSLCWNCLLLSIIPPPSAGKSCPTPRRIFDLETGNLRARFLCTFVSFVSLSWNCFLLSIIPPPSAGKPTPRQGASSTFEGGLCDVVFLLALWLRQCAFGECALHSVDSLT